MSEAPLMLGVSGLRGIVGKSLTPEVAARYAGVVGAWVLHHGPKPRGVEAAKKRSRPVVAVGRDGRRGGIIITNAVVSGLAAAGCDVIAGDVMMTPTLGVFVDRSGASAGIMITASHNPQEWNGIKVLLPDRGAKADAVSSAAPGAALAAELVAAYREGLPPWVSDWQRLGLIEVVQDNVAHLVHGKQVLDALAAALGEPPNWRKRPLVAIDCVGASGALFTPGFVKEALSCRVLVSGDYDDGVFPHMPEPTRDNLSAFAGTIRAKKAHIGFAQDPDADRLAIVDERGQYIGEEYTLALAAESLLAGLKARPPKSKRRADRILVTNLSTSRMLDDIAAAHGARVVRTPVGEANVVEAMKREKAAGHEVVLGGEGNGGVIWPKVTYVRDSLSAMALVLSLMARTGKKVSELVAAIPAYAIEKRKVELTRKEHARPAVEKIAAAYQDQTIDLQDGIRVDWPARRAWLHVRASNTEPIMRLIAEAPDAAEARAILDDAARVIAG